MGARVHREPTEKHPRKKGRPSARQTAPPFDRLPGRPENATSQVQRGQIGKGRRTGAIRKINKEDDATAGVAAASEVARFRREPPRIGKPRRRKIWCPETNSANPTVEADSDQTAGLGAKATRYAPGRSRECRDTPTEGSRSPSARLRNLENWAALRS